MVNKVKLKELINQLEQLIDLRHVMWTNSFAECQHQNSSEIYLEIKYLVDCDISVSFSLKKKGGGV